MATHSSYMKPRVLGSSRSAVAAEGEQVTPRPHTEKALKLIRDPGAPTREEAENLVRRPRSTGHQFWASCTHISRTLQLHSF